MHCTGKAFQIFAHVVMPVSAICHVMIMIMGMRDRMRMCCSIMRVSKRVLMLMRVMPDQSICHYECRSSEHYDQCNKVRP